MWESFNKIQGVILVIIAISLAFIFWYFAPQKSISLSLALPIFIVLIFLIMTLINAAYISFQLSKPGIPKVILGKKPSSTIGKAKAICMLESSELFSYDSLVSFYYIENGNFEQLIGSGNVTNIQDDGKIQVVLEHVIEGQEDIVEKLTNNDKSLLSKTIVKPNLPRIFFDLISHGG